MIALWELALPRRALMIARSTRWAANIAIVILNTAVLRLLLPVAASGVALFAQRQGLGLFNLVDVYLPIAVILSVMILDLVIYKQHVLMHRVPLLWRLHRVHHIDLDYDVTTGSRFHPVEIVISMLIKCAAILLLGPPVIAVVIFEILLNGAAMFNHGNIKLPATVDRWLRKIIVTPDMHRVHHSVIPKEFNSNFGFNLPWWDRLFGTYLEQPMAGHEGMMIGLSGFRDPEQACRLVPMLKIPFISKSH